MSVKFQARIADRYAGSMQRIPLEFLTKFHLAGHCGRLLTKKEFALFQKNKKLEVQVFYKDGSGSFTLRLDPDQINIISKYRYRLKKRDKLFAALQKLNNRYGSLTSMWDRRFNSGWEHYAGLLTELHLYPDLLTSIYSKRSLHGVETVVEGPIVIRRYFHVRRELIEKELNPQWYQPDTIFSLLKQFFTKKPKVNVVYTFPGLQEKTVKLHINENVLYQD